jgi:hypothetical protein
VETANDAEPAAVGHRIRNYFCSYESGFAVGRPGALAVLLLQKDCKTAEMRFLQYRDLQDMAKASSVSRAPRGTRIVAKAFFAAADEIPEQNRAEVVKAALALIRDELKTTREKVATAKAKAKGKTAKVPASNGRKAAVTPKAPVRAVKKAAAAKRKAPAKRARKEPSPPPEPAVSFETDETSEI